MKVGAPIIGLNDFGRGAHPGRRRVAGRLRRHLPAQRPGVRCRAADLGHPRTVRRRRGLFAGHHRLHGHGRRHELHVRHRTGRGEDRDPRRCRRGVPRRRDDPHDTERRRASRGARRGRAHSMRRARCWHICRRTTWQQPPIIASTDPSDRMDSELDDRRPRRSADAVRHARRPAPRHRRRCVPRDPAGLGAEHHRRVRAARRPQRRHRRAAARGPRRRARHRCVGQGRTVRPDLRRLQRPAR